MRYFLYFTITFFTHEKEQIELISVKLIVT